MQTNKQNLTTEQKGTAFRTKFWSMLTVFYALFVIRDVFSVQFPVIVYLMWVAMMAFVFNETETKALLISFIPLAPGFQCKFATLICMIFLLLKHLKQLKLPLFSFIVPILMLWEFPHLAERFSSTAEYLSGFAPLMCLMIILALPYKEEDTVFFTRTLAISTFVGSLIALYNTIAINNQSLISLIQDGFRFGTVEGESLYKITYNENGLGYMCNMSIAGLLTNIYFKRAKKIDYFLSAFAVVVGCLTVSRTFLLCLAGTFVLYILLQKKTTAQKAKVFLSVCVIILVSFFIINAVAPGIIENYVTRFTADDITGGRAGLYVFYNKFITSSPSRFWYGIGVQNINMKIQALQGVEVNVPHNGYQQLVVAWGVVGLFFLMLFIVLMVFHAKKRNAQGPLICYLPLILLLVSITGGQFITSGTKLLSLTFIYLIICNGGKGLSEKRNSLSSI